MNVLLFEIIFSISLILVLLSLIYFRKEIKYFVLKHKKKVISLIATISVASTGAIIYSDQIPEADVWNENGEVFFRGNAPANSFGVTSWALLNHSWFQGFYNNYVSTLLRASFNNVTWHDANEGLTTVANWSENTESYKITWIINTSTAPNDMYYQLYIGIDKRCLNFIDDKTNHSIRFNVPDLGANNDNLSISFDFSDLIPLINNNRIWVSRGTYDVDNQTFAYLRIQTTNKLNNATVFEIDPDFGYWGSGSNNYVLGNDCAGSTFTANASGTVDNIFVHYRERGCPPNVVNRAAIALNSTKAIVTNGESDNYTHYQDEGALGWHQFNFSGGNPEITDGTEYLLFFGTDGPQNNLRYNAGSGYIAEDSFTGEHPLPDPFSVDSSSVGTILIYCSYTLAPSNTNPVNSNPYPADATTGVDVDLARLNITVNDAEDASQNMNITFRTNASGGWLNADTNSSVNNGTYQCINTTWINSNNTQYWWSVNTSDGNGGWDNDTYTFTTEDKLDTTVDALVPYAVTWNPLTITATSNNATPDNVSLYYRWSDDNSTWDGGATGHFGKTNTTGSSALQAENAVIGGSVYYGAEFTPSADGEADNITAYFYSDGNHNIRCALYDNGTRELITNGVSEQRTINTGVSYHHQTFNFTGTKPLLNTSTVYLAVMWSNNPAGNCRLRGHTTTGHNSFVYQDSATYNGFPDPFVQSATANSGASIYVNYTESEWSGYDWSLYETDLTSPWSWEFDFPNGTGYYEFYSVAKSSTHDDEPTPGSADTLCQYTSSSYGPNNVLKITIESDYVNNTLTDFPFLVVLNSTISAECDSGRSIKFNNSDNTTEFYHELENTTADWNNAGENFVWVNVTTISSSVDTVIWMTYNDSSCDNQENVTNTWNSHYLGVWHMRDNTTSQIKDSTSNNLDGTKIEAGGPAVNTSGKIGNAQTFDQSNDNITISHNVIMNITGQVTVEYWLLTHTITGDDRTFLTNDWWGPYCMWLRDAYGGVASNIWCTGESGTAGQYAAPGVGLTNNTWYYLAGTTIDSDVTKTFKNGSLEDTQGISYTMQNHTGQNINFGSSDAGTDLLDGVLDEIRLSDIAWNQTWIGLTYNSSNQTDGLVTFGVEAAPADQTHSTTIRNDGVDYFIWLGTNTSAWAVYRNLTGFSTSEEYVAIWNATGSWWNCYQGTADASANNWSITTFDVVKVFLNDSVGNQTFSMTENADWNDSYETITHTLVDVGAGYNYTGWHNTTSTTLSAENTSIGLASGYGIALWNETHFEFDPWISHWAYNVNKNIHRWNVCLTKISTNRNWVQP